MREGWAGRSCITGRCSASDQIQIRTSYKRSEQCGTQSAAALPSVHCRFSCSASDGAPPRTVDSQSATTGSSCWPSFPRAARQSAQNGRKSAAQSVLQEPLLCAAHEQTMGEHGTLVAAVCGDVLEVEQLAVVDAREGGLDAAETEGRCHARDVGGGGLSL